MSTLHFNPDESFSQVIDSCNTTCHTEDLVTVLQLNPQLSPTKFNEFLRSCCNMKFGFLFGFEFKSNVNHANPSFSIMFSAKIKSALMRQTTRGMSVWEIWKNIDRTNKEVLAAAQLLREYQFDVDEFYTTDEFVDSVNEMIQTVRIHIRDYIRPYIERMRMDEEKIEAKRLLKMIEESLTIANDTLRRDQTTFAQKDFDREKILRARGEIRESIIDQPKESLDPSVWKRNSDGTYALQPAVKIKVLKAIKWLVSNYDIDFYALHLIGSITSNSYTDDSDIDIHVCSNSVTPETEEQFNKKMKDDYWNNYYPAHEAELNVGTHPIELYVQANEYKNMASVGCYDLVTDEWLVGPGLVDPAVDPYREYYDADMKSVQFLIDDIRTQILKPYELALAILNAKDSEFITTKTSELADSLKAADVLFDAIKRSRRIIENPTSKEDALTKRASREWKIADSTFKLLGKFGYIGILSKYSSLSAEVSQTADSTTVNAVCQEIVDAISDNFSKNADLAEDELAAYSKIKLDEGFKDWMKGAAMAGAVAASSFGYGASAAKAAPAPAKQVQTVSSKLSYDNLKNMLANVAYNEAGIDWLKNKNDDCIIAILNVIDHRSGGDSANYVKEMLRSGQFYGAKYVVGDTDATFEEYDPAEQAKEDNQRISPKQKECWDRCNSYAEKLLNGSLPDILTKTLSDGTVVKYNMIANSKKDNASAFDAWGKYCSNKIETHTFGYQPDQDGYAKYKHMPTVDITKTSAAAKPVVHVVKSGETLGKIATKYKTTVKNILAKNSSLAKNPNKIRIGQKITI